MEFEEVLKRKLEKEIRENTSHFSPYFDTNSYSRFSHYTSDLTECLAIIIDTHLSKKYGNSKSDKEIAKITNEFINRFTNVNLQKLYDNTEFSEEELQYIKYIQLSDTSFTIKTNHIIYLLIQKSITQQYDQNEITSLIEITQNRILTTNNSTKNTYTHILEILTGNLFNNVEQKLEQAINKTTEHKFNYLINCGGYALKIDTCIFPFGKGDFSKQVSTLLKTFPFIRLLGDTPLEYDEYLVMYRARKDGGHHFVRINDDNTVTEKNDVNPIQTFNDWNVLENSPEAIFAVKKEHQMFGYKNLNLNDPDKHGLNFEETVNEALNNKNNSFTYHGHKYRLKQTPNGEILVTSNDSIIADVLTEDNECIAIIHDDKKNYVENLLPHTPLIIQNGKLMNRNQLTKHKPKVAETKER